MIKRNKFKQTLIFVPTFVTKVTEYLCSESVFFLRQNSTFQLAIFDGLLFVHNSKASVVLIGYRQSLTKFTAPKASDYSIDYYNHKIIRPNEDLFLNNDPFASPQLNEKIFIKTPYTFTFNILNKKYDNVISEALRNIHAYTLTN